MIKEIPKSEKLNQKICNGEMPFPKTKLTEFVDIPEALAVLHQSLELYGKNFLLKG